METYRRHKILPDPEIYVAEMRSGKAPAPKAAPAHQLSLPKKPPHPKGRLRMLDIVTDDGESKHDDLVREIDRLFRHYYTPVVFGARYRAPCPVWRSERIVLRKGELPRFATRVCIYQDHSIHPDGAGTTPEGRAPASHIDEIGGLLGFISLRPQDANASHQVAVAHLSCPSHMKRPRYHILSTALGPPDGVMTFRGTPYYQPWVSQDAAVRDRDAAPKDPNVPPNRAICLHASLYSALLLKSSTFHCSPISSHDLLARLWQEQNRHHGAISMKAIAVQGFNLEQCLDVLSSADANAGGCLETISTFEFFFEARDILEQRREMLRRAGPDGKEAPAEERLGLFRQEDSSAECARLLQDIGFQILKELGISPDSLQPTASDPAISPQERAAVLLQFCDVAEFTRLGANYDHVASELPGRPSSLELLKHVRNRRIRICRAYGRHPLFASLPDVQMLLAKREARLCMAEYLANGMPIIASISDRARDYTSQYSEGHSALIVGMHFQNPVPKPTPTPGYHAEEEWPYEKSDNFLPSSFILHDITQAPFWEVSAKNLLTASVYSKYEEDFQVLDGAFSYLAITPRGTRIGIRDVRRYADALRKIHLNPDNSGTFAEEYRKAFGLKETPSPATTCMRTRLMSTQDIIRWYIRPVTNQKEPGEEDLRLHTRGYAEACKLITSRPSAGSPPTATESPQTRWWCVECHSDAYRSSSFRDYATWMPPILVYCWPVDHDSSSALALPGSDPDRPGFTIRSTGRWECTIRRPNLPPVIFETRYVAPQDRASSSLPPS